MRAAVYRRAGAARDVLAVEELDDPSPAPGEVRVRLAYSGLNPTDTKRRVALDPPGMQVPHHDGAGIIDMVGDGVDADLIGSRTWLYHAAWDRPLGTAAEYTCIPAEQAVPLGDDIDMAFAATIGIPFMTAAHALFMDGPVQGQQVVVTGGGGAVGNAAIRLATHAGAQVTAIVGSEPKGRLAREAGAHAVLDRTSPTFVDDLADHFTVGIDRVVDVAIGRNLPLLAPHLFRGAHVVAYASDVTRLECEVRPLMDANASLRFFIIYLLDQRALATAVTRVQEYLAGGRAVAILPTQVFALEDVAQAHEALEARPVGKVLVRI